MKNKKENTMEIQEVINNKDNKEFILKAVKESGKLLEFASAQLQNDEEVVKEALKQDGEALEFVSDNLKNNNDGNTKCSLDNLLCLRKIKKR